MRDHLALYINGAPHTVRGRDALLSLSDYVRQRLGLIGTKIVCSEGDCGACTVLVGKPTKRKAESGKQNETNPTSEFSTTSRSPLSALRFTYLPIDSCIQFMFQLDGAHVVTVEGLRRDGSLNAVQQAMIDCHGSQCGFCTPGFVMAMTGLRENCDQLAEPELRTGLTGNLCRCTGYTPIVEAGLKSGEAEHERLNELYSPEPILADLQPRTNDAIRIECESFGVQHVLYSPSTLEEALGFLTENPSALIVAGATDIGVRVNKSKQLPPIILDLNRIAELDNIRTENGALIAGARASWTALLNACSLATPEFARILSIFGAPQIRHVGTIAGNIANASPIADSLPFLFVMEAMLVLASKSGRREVNINDFYYGYKKFDLKPGELIAEVRIPLPTDADLLRLYKVSRRRDLDISSFTAAVRIQLDGDLISHAAIALGAVGPVVLRARRTEQFLVGQPFTELTMQLAGEVAVEEITPIDDVRGAADYRRQLTRNILHKLYHQTQADLAPA